MTAETVSSHARNADGSPASARPWWRRGVVYEIYVRSFQDGNGDGVGDLDGIVRRLDHLAGSPDSLGVDAIWLTPFYPSPMADFGYDVSDYTDVHPLFGDLAAFDRLVAAAHQHGLRVIVDLVPNHSSDQHPWFLAARSSRQDPKRGWYVWADPKPDGSPPNNWTAAFGGKSWEWDAATGQYYYHYFLPRQPDLNWRNPDMAAAMHDVVRFWLGRGVDGLRVDACQVLVEDDQLRDNPPRTGPLGRFHLGPEYETQRHVHDVDHPGNHDVIRGLRRVVDEFPDRVMIGEVYLLGPGQVAPYYGRDDEFHLCFNFVLLNAPWDARELREAIEAFDASLPPGAWPGIVFGSHDAHRVATRHGLSRVRAAAVLFLTLRGTPTIYYGDELGMEDGDIPPERLVDPWAKEGGGLGRDPERTPMPWDAAEGPFLGFSDVEPWLPLSCAEPAATAAAQRRDPDSVLSLYRRLLAYRRTSAPLSAGDYRPLAGQPDDCLVFERRAGNESVVVAVNAGTGDRAIELPGPGRVAVATERAREDEAVDGRLVLRPDEAVVVEVAVETRG